MTEGHHFSCFTVVQNCLDFRNSSPVYGPHPPVPYYNHNAVREYGNKAWLSARYGTQPLKYFATTLTIYSPK